MRPEDIMNAMQEVDDSLLLEAEKYRSEKGQLAALKRARKRRREQRIMTVGLVAAACLVVLVGAPSLLPKMGSAGKKAMDSASFDLSNLHEEAAMETAPETLAELPLAAGQSAESAVSKDVIPLACAIYPERTRYPEANLQEGNVFEYKEEDSDTYHQIYEEQFAASQLRQSLDKRGLDAFTRDSIDLLLAGAGKKNAVISPVNLYMALSILAETTAGESEQKMLTALHVDSKEELRDFSDGLWNSMYADNGLSTMIPASTLWLRTGSTYRQDTLQLLADRYYADSFSGIPGTEEMNEMLREWMNERTKGLLQDSVQELSIPARSELTIASTLLYSAHWIEKFSSQDNEMLTFHAPSGDREEEFLVREGSAMIYFPDTCAAFPVYLEDNKCMWVLLPTEGQDPEAVLADDSLYRMLADNQKFPNKRVARYTLKLPKFDVSAKYDLEAMLRTMGLSDLFDPGKADFSALSDRDNLVLGGGDHIARVKIDEEGVEAAAATLLGVCGAGEPPEEKIDLVFDRPFAFLITEGVGDNIYFAGIVNEPGQ